MKIFNENGDFLGEFIEATGEVIQDTQEIVCSWFDIGIVLGIVGLIISPFWTILAIIAILIFKLIAVIIKFSLRCLWWIVKLPFVFLFCRKLPNF